MSLNWGGGQERGQVAWQWEGLGRTLQVREGPWGRQGRGGERPVLGTRKPQDPHGYGMLALNEAWDLRDHLADGEIEAGMEQNALAKTAPLRCS